MCSLKWVACKGFNAITTSSTRGIESANEEIRREEIEFLTDSEPPLLNEIKNCMNSNNMAGEATVVSVGLWYGYRVFESRRVPGVVKRSPIQDDWLFQNPWNLKFPANQHPAYLFNSLHYGKTINNHEKAWINTRQRAHKSVVRCVLKLWSEEWNLRLKLFAV